MLRPSCPCYGVSCGILLFHSAVFSSIMAAFLPCDGILTHCGGPRQCGSLFVYAAAFSPLGIPSLPCDGHLFHMTAMRQHTPGFGPRLCHAKSVFLYFKPFSTPMGSLQHIYAPHRKTKFLYSFRFFLEPPPPPVSGERGFLLSGS